jgi:glutaredoxin
MLTETHRTKIRVYGKSGCDDTDAAIKVLDKAHADYEYKNIKRGKKAKKEAGAICKVFGRGLSTPVITIETRTGPNSGQIVFVEPRGQKLKLLYKAARSSLRK